MRLLATYFRSVTLEKWNSQGQRRGLAAAVWLGHSGHFHVRRAHESALNMIEPVLARSINDLEHFWAFVRTSFW
jgi:hypothetical protein